MWAASGQSLTASSVGLAVDTICVPPAGLSDHLAAADLLALASPAHAAGECAASVSLPGRPARWN